MPLTRTASAWQVRLPALPSTSRLPTPGYARVRLCGPPPLGSLTQGVCSRTQLQELRGDGLSNTRGPAGDDGQLLLQQAGRQAALQLAPRRHVGGGPESQER